MAAKKVIIYRNELLPSSETFIRAQAGMLRKFTPIFAGLRSVGQGLDLTNWHVISLANSQSLSAKLKRRVFLRTGRSGSFLHAIAREKPEFVHAHFAVDASAVLPVAQRLQVPLVVTLHGYDVTRAAELSKKWPTTQAYLRRRTALMDYAAAFICVSEHVKRQALTLGFPEKKLRVHPIGVDLNLPEKQKYPRDKDTVLVVGRLVEKKGCSYLIRAMSMVKNAFPQARLVIIGDGPLRKALEEEVARNSVTAMFLGQQEHEVVRQWMRKARILVAPSVCAGDGDSEGLPTVLCEAQSEGLPPVTFATDGVVEALPPERREGLPEEKDVTALAAQIAVFLGNDEMWRSASEAGKRWMKLRFDLRFQTQILEELYAEVIERHHA